MKDRGLTGRLKRCNMIWHRVFISLFNLIDPSMRCTKYWPHLLLHKAYLDVHFVIYHALPLTWFFGVTCTAFLYLCPYLWSESEFSRSVSWRCFPAFHAAMTESASGGRSVSGIGNGARLCPALHVHAYHAGSAKKNEMKGARKNVRMMMSGWRKNVSFWTDKNTNVQSYYRPPLQNSPKNTMCAMINAVGQRLRTRLSGVELMCYFNSVQPFSFQHRYRLNKG